MHSFNGWRPQKASNRTSRGFTDRKASQRQIQNLKFYYTGWSITNSSRKAAGGVIRTIGFIWSYSTDLSIDGTSSAARVDISRLPLENLKKLGSALLDRVPNPFFGIPEADELSLTRVIARAQLLRPFPQFQRVGKVRAGVRNGRYNALIVKAERRNSSMGIPSLELVRK